jgi:hypothetical protein
MIHGNFNNRINKELTEQLYEKHKLELELFKVQYRQDELEADRSFLTSFLLHSHLPTHTATPSPFLPL